MINIYEIEARLADAGFRKHRKCPTCTVWQHGSQGEKIVVPISGRLMNHKSVSAIEHAIKSAQKDAAKRLKKKEMEDQTMPEATRPIETKRPIQVAPVAKAELAKYFSEARVGDRVFHLMFGWGTIANLTPEILEVLFLNKKYPMEFLHDGKMEPTDARQSLFWGEPSVNPPGPPKRPVTKTKEVWANVFVNDQGGYYFGLCFLKEGAAEEHVDHKKAVAVATGLFEFTVKE